MSNKIRRVAIYARVSSDVQRVRETILSQLEALERYLLLDPMVVIVGKYIDDGVSGPIPLAERPEGGRLLADAGRRLFDEVWMFKVDRLGRDDIDPLVVRRQLDNLGIRLFALHENIDSPFEFALRVAFAAEERRNFIQRSAAGMERAARDGRYCGGIVPLGYRVEGTKQTARLVPSNENIWGDLTEADLVRDIYRRLVVDGWSCRKIGDELNALGVPTAYEKDGRLVCRRRGERKARTQGKWRAGRIRNLVTNPLYKGELHYGRRSAKGREIIVAKIEGLVSEEVWNAAQETLARNRIIAKNTSRVYLLRSVIKCGLCGLTYSGYWDRGQVRYKCNGALADRGPIEGRCPNRSFYGHYLEYIVWADILRWLRNPDGDVLVELASETAGSSAAAAEADRLTLEKVLESFRGQRDRILDLYRREVITPEEMESQLQKIVDEQREVEARLLALTEQIDARPEPISPELLEQLQAALDEELDDVRRQAIVLLLVSRIMIRTEDVDGEKRVVAAVEYRFPGVVSFSRGTHEGHNYTLRRVVRL